MDFDTKLREIIYSLCVHSQKAPDGTVTVIYEGLSPENAIAAIKQLIRECQPGPSHITYQYSTFEVDRFAYDFAFDSGVEAYAKNLGVGGE